MLYPIEVVKLSCEFHWRIPINDFMINTFLEKFKEMTEYYLESAYMANKSQLLCKINILIDEFNAVKRLIEKNPFMINKKLKLDISQNRKLLLLYAQRGMLLNKPLYKADFGLLCLLSYTF